ncbi:protein NIM1-INTERACTING 1 [Telopea speciosissima]|uniref:protein NIM1-INTERACTING 1 n=1 Tax=Telopea speciosissima TaxID=54955 RepID=UPI001CC6594D|nr:protein NIM1-INTERACTING 1 [Telopea speciosissima]
MNKEEKDVKKELESAEEEDEEEKIERFFALIRSFRDVRDSARKRELNNDTKKKDKEAEKKSGKSLWVPSFKREDFAEQIEFKTPSLIRSSCNREGDDNIMRKKQKKNHKEKEEEEEEDQGVRLNLQLAL